MTIMDFELVVFDYIEETNGDIDSDALIDIGAELRDIVDLACSEYALDNGLEYEGG